MQITITTVDYAPGDLYDQVPFVAELLRELPGPDRPDYWVAELLQPLSWLKDNQTRSVAHIVVAARWAGTSIEAGVGNLPIGIAYVIDPSVLTDKQLDLQKCAYVAIGLASDTTHGRIPPELGSTLAGNIAPSFGTGRAP
jgi:hypothetical protein